MHCPTVVAVVLQVVVLGWCTSQRDMEVVRKILHQVSVASFDSSYQGPTGEHNPYSSDPFVSTVCRQ